MNTPKFELFETNHGVDGWDAKTNLVARFTTKELAHEFLAARGFTHVQFGSFYHQDPSRRHCMGCVSYGIAEAKQVPEDPK